MRGMEGPMLQLGTTIAGERFSLPQDAVRAAARVVYGARGFLVSCHAR